MVEWLVPITIHALAVINVTETTPKSVVEDIALQQVNINSSDSGVEYEFQFAEVTCAAIRSAEGSQK